MPIRILVVGLPQMQKEIVCSLLDKEGDLVLVDCVDDDRGVSEMIRATETDVLVRVSPESALREVAGGLLEEHPRLRIVALTPNGSSAFRVDLRPHVAKIHEVSPEGLMEAIRGIPRPDPFLVGASETH